MSQDSIKLLPTRAELEAEIDRLRAALRNLVSAADAAADSANVGTMDEAIQLAREILG